MRCGVGCDYAVFKVPATPFFWNEKENTLNKIPKVCGLGAYERKVLKGILVLKSCSPKFSHLEAKCKQKNDGTE